MKELIIIGIGAMVLYALTVSDKPNAVASLPKGILSPAANKPVTVADLSKLGLGGGGSGGGDGSGNSGGQLREYNSGFYDPFDTPFFRGELDWQQRKSYRQENPYEPGVINVSQLT